MANRGLDWNSERRDWPYAETSRFIQNGMSHWHVQTHHHPGGEFGSRKPIALLLHGTGASTHSWSWLIPQLTDAFDLIAVDLPGHGFTRTQSSSALSLPAMAFGVAKLMGALDHVPSVIIGHSAGVAIGLQIAANQSMSKLSRVVGVNAALQPIEGNNLLSPLAKLLFVNPITPRLFAWQARHTAIADKMLDATGSKLTDRQRDYYLRLFGASAHVEGALGMMANWELAPLRRQIENLDMDVTLLAARGDRMVPPTVSQSAARNSGRIAYKELLTGGHLVHETHPQMVAEEILVASDQMERAV
ncbi:MAG: alpha/beta fold hydrolase BchO [Pseudomonadota bacterium]